MKALWIILAVLAGVGVMCSGGNCVLGTRLFSKSVHISEDAQTFALESVKKLGTDWDIKELQKRASQDYKPTAASKVAEEFFAIAKTKLGALKSFPGFTKVVPDKTSTSEDGVITKINFGGDAMFEKAAAGIEITVVKAGENWQISYFQVNSPLFHRM